MLVQGVMASLALFLSAPSHAAMFIQAWGEYQVWASSDPRYGDQEVSFVIPYSFSESVTNDVNGAFAESSYSVSATRFDVSYFLSRPPTVPYQYSKKAQVKGRLDIKVDEAVPYVLSAEMSVLDSEGRNTHQWLKLYENGGVIFQNFQLSSSTIDPHFILGRQDGDLNNILTGSLTGVFLPGRTYRFEYDARLLDSPSPSLQTATATGYFSLVLVPEPSAALLIALGLVGMTVWRSNRAGQAG